MTPTITTSSGTLTFTDSNNSSIYATGNVGLGILNPNQTFTINTPNKMKQVKAALFKVIRDPKTNEIIDSEFVKEFWVKQKPGVSFDVAAAHANGYAIDPEIEVIRELFTVNFY